MWQWWAPELWRRFTIALRRQLARHLGLSETATRQLVRVQFAKVAEYQRRGVIHFHALIRLDGRPTDLDPYPPRPSRSTRRRWPTSSARPPARSPTPLPRSTATISPRRLRFGAQIDARPVTGAADRETHGARAAPRDRRRLHRQVRHQSRRRPADRPRRRQRAPATAATTLRHLAGRASFASLTGGEEPYKGWGRWVDMLGFRGHLATKSRRYSTTLGRLRQARRDYTRRAQLPASDAAAEWADQDQDLEDTTLVIGSWRFAGMGWLTLGDAALAAASAARARDD